MTVYFYVPPLKTFAFPSPATFSHNYTGSPWVTRCSYPPWKCHRQFSTWKPVTECPHISLLTHKLVTSSSSGAYFSPSRVDRMCIEQTVTLDIREKINKNELDRRMKGGQGGYSHPLCWRQLRKYQNRPIVLVWALACVCVCGQSTPAANYPT